MFVAKYPAARFKRRAYLTSFGGSAGTAVVTEDKAALFVDPRYWEYAQKVVAEGWEVVRLRDLDNMTPEKWICQHLPNRAKIACDPKQFAVKEMNELQKALEKKEMETVFLEINPVDRIWEEKPPLSEEVKERE